MRFHTRKWVKPEDLNPNSTLFGGRLLAWIDEEIALYAIIQLESPRIVTKHMSEINFRSSAKQGDIVEIGIDVVKFGTTSLTLMCEVRNMTNFGLFRKYITNYLEHYPDLNKNMILLCRQLQSTQYGIPLEIYVFSKDQRFVQYEYIIADIFDHIIASIDYFDLEIFEMPTDKNNFAE